MSIPGTVLFAQNQAAQVSGFIKDSSGAVIPNAEVIVTNKDTGVDRRTVSNNDGNFVMPLLQPGHYKITVTANEFEVVLRDGITLAATQNANLDFVLKPGSTKQTVTVYGDAAQINVENAQLQTEIPPTTLENLPLIVSGGPRNMSGLITLIPGVTSPTSTPTTAHMNGGLEYEEETVLDGISIYRTTGGSGLFNLTLDFPQSPDMIREVNVLTSNFSPEYGNSAGSVIIMETKSGTDQFHGVVFDYLRNTVLNAAQYGAKGVRPPDIENDFGGSIGGPIALPKVRTAKSQPFFFAMWEGYRAAGGTTSPVISIPSLKERAGDFSDWVGSSGNLIPIFDPATTQIVNGQVVRQQFMGCDGNTPNVICPTDPRLQNSIAQGWLKYLPTPTSSGPLNNYMPAHPPSSLYSNRNTFDSRIDENYGERDHLSASLYRMAYVPVISTLLPVQLSTEVFCAAGSCINYMIRLNEDHTFSPSLLNHFAYGVTRAGNNAQYYPNEKYLSQLPQIAGMPYSSEFTTGIGFGNGFASFDGSNHSIGWSNINVWNDLVEWTHGKHVFKFGGEYHRIAVNEAGGGTPGGALSFAPGETAVLTENSGSSIASFLLGQVDVATATVYGAGGRYYPRQSVSVLYAADTWKATPRLSLSYGVRWDLHPPSVEKYNRMSFFDPTGLNPSANDLPGRLAFAGKQWGAATYGYRYPETTVLTDFAPRIGFAYSTDDSRTSVRGGYGISYSDAKYPGWGMGVSSSGFDANPAFSSTLGGLQAATLLSAGLPQNYARPPFINSGYLNGLAGPLYRPVDSNHIPYSQQWDLAVERQVTGKLYASLTYAGNKGTHLYSALGAPNALNPGLLSLGSKLYDQFGPNDSSVDGVAAPYPGWAQQMTSCAPSVAQALLPFPQYCGSIAAVNENKGGSFYNSLQGKVERRASTNGYLLASYSFSKMMDNVDSTQPSAEVGSTTSAFSPFQRWRNWSVSAGDIRQTFTAAYVYHLPFGRGQRWINSGKSVVEYLVSGWETSGVVHINSAPPFFFRSGSCHVPGQFDAVCVPAILSGQKPFAQSSHGISLASPLFNVSAFENPSNTDNFNFYLGAGARVESSVRAFPYQNEDMALYKDTRITERLHFQLRGEVFNLWNWHVYQGQGNAFTTNTSAFTTDVGSPAFGMWNGSVTAPRNIQVAGRLSF
jgi:hypothetical protein